jgi:nitrite reductase (NADH) large subunit
MSKPGEVRTAGAGQSSSRRETVLVIGNGMVGLRFCEKLVEYDTARQYHIITFCEEPRAAYDRVGLTSFFAHRDAEKLMLARREWYSEHGIELHIGDRATQIDRNNRLVRSDKGLEVAYDRVVLATGSYPFVPPVPGINKRGIFVYRTIEDLEQILAYAARVKTAAVIGGGLLGLEAAKAAYDLGLDTHVIEFAPRLMPRQIDEAGSRILVRRIEALGVRVHLNATTQEVLGDGTVEAIRFADGGTLETDMILISAGIRPRDELARACGLTVGERGGVVVNDRLESSDRDIYAIGEVALHAGKIYGLVAPGWQMATVVARNLTGGDERFTGTDLSAKLKLMDVDVACFGEYEAGPDQAQPLTWEDPFAGVYKKLLFSHDGSRLLGGVLVGDARDYGSLSVTAKSGSALPCRPHELVIGRSGPAAAAGGIDTMPDTAQVCSCNNVTKGAILTAIRAQRLTAVGQVKACTSAGTGCGGCMPIVTDLSRAAMQEAGVAVCSP